MSPDTRMGDRLPNALAGLAMTGFASKNEGVSAAYDKSLHALLIDAGKLRPEHAEAIRNEQREHNLRFSEAAVKLGFITRSDLETVLSGRNDIPQPSIKYAAYSPELVAAAHPFNPQVEALRALRSQLMLRWFENATQRKVLAVVSPERGEGRSFVAANLAVVLSQVGERTLLVDADMRNPRQHVIFGVENSRGLSSVLSGQADLDSVQRISSLNDLSVLPSGTPPLNPQELIARPLFIHMLSELAGEFDIIVIDTPAGKDCADAQTIAARAGGALMVLRMNFSQMKPARELAHNIAETGATVVGSVMNTF